MFPTSPPTVLHICTAKTGTEQIQVDDEKISGPRLKWALAWFVSVSRLRTTTIRTGALQRCSSAIGTFRLVGQQVPTQQRERTLRNTCYFGSSIPMETQPTKHPHSLLCSSPLHFESPTGHYMALSRPPRPPLRPASPSDLPKPPARPPPLPSLRRCSRRMRGDFAGFGGIVSVNITTLYVAFCASASRGPPRGPHMGPRWQLAANWLGHDK